MRFFMRLDKALLNPLCLSLALATVASFGLPKAAQAALFHFSYTTSTGVLTGTLDGTLQSDNDTVFVTAVGPAFFNGVPGPALPVLSSATTFLGGSAPPTVSLSGLNLDIYTATSAGDDGFTFIPAGLFGPEPVFISGPSFGEIFEGFDRANWSLTPKSVPVPEPSAVVALALVGGGLLLSQRRKAA
jgi:hypothetical protein